MGSLVRLGARHRQRGLAGCWLYQLSRHDAEASDVDRSDLVYAATIIPINWANRSRWMRRRSVRERCWL
jgi:hypothetical protein